MIRWVLTTARDDVEAARVPGEWIPGYDDSRPLLQPDTAALVGHFWRLSGGRGAGNGFSSVPPRLAVSEIEALHRWHGLGDYWTPAEFLTAMQACDGEFVAFHVEQADAEDERRKAEKT